MCRTGHAAWGDATRQVICEESVNFANRKGTMKHTTAIDKDAGIIFCTLEGELDIQNAIAVSKSLRETAAQSGLPVLCEASGLREPQSDMPVHDLTVKLSTILESIMLRDVRVALIYRPGTYDEYWRFYEEAAAKRGLLIKVFGDRGEAQKWLVGA